MLTVERVYLKIPDQSCVALPHRQPHQAGPDRLGGQIFGKELCRPLDSGPGGSHRQSRPRHPEMVCGTARRLGGIKRRLQKVERAGEIRQKRVVDAQDSAVSTDVDVQLRVIDRNSEQALAIVDVRRARDLRIHDVGDFSIGHVRRQQPKRVQTPGDVAVRDLHGAAPIWIAQVASAVPKPLGGPSSRVETHIQVRNVLSQRLDSDPLAIGGGHVGQGRPRDSRVETALFISSGFRELAGTVPVRLPGNRHDKRQ